MFQTAKLKIAGIAVLVLWMGWVSMEPYDLKDIAIHACGIKD